MNIQDCIRANETALEAMRRAVANLQQLEAGMSDDDQARIDSQIDRTSHEIELLERVNAHLRASVVTILPIDPAVEARLRHLATVLDDAIRRDAILNASLEMTIDIINSAKELGAILDDHT